MKRVTYVLARRDKLHPWRVYRKERWRPSYLMFRLETFETLETFECIYGRSENGYAELTWKAAKLNEELRVKELDLRRRRRAVETFEKREKELEPYVGRRLL